MPPGHTQGFKIHISMAAIPSWHWNSNVLIKVQLNEAHHLFASKYMWESQSIEQYLHSIYFVSTVSLETK